jgi:hypothetical protein
MKKPMIFFRNNYLQPFSLQLSGVFSALDKVALE